MASVLLTFADYYNQLPAILQWEGDAAQWKNRKIWRKTLAKKRDPPIDAGEGG
jgi:hypothetical protein